MLTTGAVDTPRIQVKPETVFEKARTVEQKLYRLADLYADARTWRLEEAEELDRLKKRVTALERARKVGPDTRIRW
jgi:hypothetical protein